MLLPIRITAIESNLDFDRIGKIRLGIFTIDFRLHLPVNWAHRHRLLAQFLVGAGAEAHVWDVLRKGSSGEKDEGGAAEVPAWPEQSQ